MLKTLPHQHQKSHTILHGCQETNQQWHTFGVFVRGPVPWFPHPHPVGLHHQTFYIGGFSKSAVARTIHSIPVGSGNIGSYRL